MYLVISKYFSEKEKKNPTGSKTFQGSQENDMDPQSYFEHDII